MNTSSDIAVQIEAASIVLGKRRVVRDLSLDVRDREVVALLGASGSGKTTILRSIAGLQRLYAGRLSVSGAAVDVPAQRLWTPPERRSVGFVFQDFALFPHLTVEGNVRFGAIDKSEVSGVLERVGLPGYGTRRVTELSGGEQQRVALARVLAQKPRVVLLDEPFSNLDRGLRRRLRESSLAAIHASGAAAVLVTHDPEEALSSADRVAVIRSGELLQFATPETVYRSPNSADVALATGEAFLVAVDDDGNSAIGHLQTTGSGSRAVVRPEQIDISEHDVPNGSAVNNCAFLGHAFRVSFDQAGTVYHATSSRPLAVGTPISLRVNGVCQRIEHTGG